MFITSVSSYNNEVRKELVRMRCFMDKTTEVIGRIFDTKEAVPNSFLTTIEEEMIVLQNKISDLEKKNLNLLIQNSSSQKFKSEIQVRESELASLKNELANSEKKLTTQEYEIIQYKEQIQRLNIELEKLSAIAETEKKNYLSEKKKIESHAFDFVFDLSQKYKDGLSENEIALRQIRTDLQKANGEVHSKEMHIKNLQNKISVLEADYQKLLQTNENEKQSYTEQRKKLEKQAFEFVNDNCQMEIQILSLKHELEASQNQYVKIKNDLSNKTIDLQQAEINLFEQEKVCADLNSRLANLTKELEKAQEKIAASLETQSKLDMQLQASEQDKVTIDKYKQQTENLYAEIEYAKKRYEEETGYKLKLERNKTNLALEKSLLQGALGTLQSENTSLQEKIAELTTKIDSLMQSISSQNTTITDLENSLRNYKDQLTYKNEELNQLSNAISLLNEEKNILLVKHSEDKKNIHFQNEIKTIELLKTISQREDELKNLKESSECQIRSLTNFMEKLEEQLKSALSQKESTEKTFHNISEKMSSQIADQNLAIAQLSNEVTSLESEIQDEEFKNLELNRQIIELKNILEVQAKNIDQQKLHYEAALDKAQLELKDAEATRLEIICQKDSLEKELLTKNNLIAEAEKNLHIKEQELNELKLSFADFKQMTISEKEKIEADVEDLIKKSDDTKILFETELENLQKQILQKEKIILDNEIKNEQLTKQATQYVKFIEAERIQVKKVLQHLTVEIKTAVTLHPLKDYRDATDLELRRVELELKKMPASSSQRRAIENRLEQLYIQRNQLNELINKTEKHISAFESELKKVEHRAQVLEVPAPADFGV